MRERDRLEGDKLGSRSKTTAGRLTHLPTASHSGRASVPISEDKREPASDIDSVVVNSLKARFPQSFIVRDVTRQALGYFYFSNQPFGVKRMGRHCKGHCHMAHENFRQRCDKQKNVFDDNGLVDDPCVKFLWIGGGYLAKTGGRSARARKWIDERTTSALPSIVPLLGP